MGKTFKKLVILLLALLCLPLIYSTDIGYILINQRVPNMHIINVFEEHNLSYDLIEDKVVQSVDLSQYRMLFIGDQKFRNLRNMPVYEYPSLIMNRHFGDEWGLTNNGISQLASTSPLNVRLINNGIVQVYTQARDHRSNIAYYYLDDKVKVETETIARTFTGNAESDFGDVIAFVLPGTQLLNGDTATEKVCFYGIAETQYWTQQAEDLFYDCVSVLIITCSSDIECNDNNGSTQDTCLNPGTPQSECIYEPIACSSDLDCGAPQLIGDLFCVDANSSQNISIPTCRNPQTVQSFCETRTEVQTIQQCQNSCLRGDCVTIRCNNDADCDDANDNTKDQCINPGTPDSFCMNEEIICKSNEDCNDNNQLTIDICINPGTVNSECEFTQIPCAKDEDCGMDGFIAGVFCSNHDLYQNFREFTCHNPATISASCSVEVSSQLVTDCPSQCIDDACITITCSQDEDCDDQNPATIDLCVNPGSIDSFCNHDNVACVADTECGTDRFIGQPYCQDDAVLRDQLGFSCNAPSTIFSFCSTHLSKEDLIVCDYACADGVCVRCDDDQDCNDNDVYTQDQCIFPNTIDSNCVFTQINCFSDLDCNDANPLTQDTCHLPGTIDSFCTNELFECNNDQDCDDGNDHTQDVCENPGTLQSMCIYTTIECLSDIECGQPGLGTPYCINNDVYKNLTDPMCQDPATIQSQCITTITPQLQQSCPDSCHQGQCVTIICNTDADCDDQNAHTQDICQNPGTPQSLCQNLPIACFSDADCNDFDALTIDTCLNPATPQSSCLNQPIECNTDADCDDSNVYTQDTCQNPGTLQSQCTYQTIICITNSDCDDADPKTKDTCQNPGTPQSVCQNLPIACNTNTDCGQSSLSLPYCQNNNVFRNLSQPLCLNPTTPQSQCTQNIIPQLQQSCPDSCNQGQCVTIACHTDADCDDQIALTLDSCLHPGTPQSVCQNLPIACNNDADCDDQNAKTKDTCQNPGTLQSQCSYQTIICLTNADCDDQNSQTQDICNNPGTPQSFCTNNIINCFSDADCPADAPLNQPYCNAQNNIAQDFQSFSCINPGTPQSVCQPSQMTQQQQNCPNQCFNGVCTNCNSNADCDQTTQTLSCSGGNVVTTTVSFTCQNPKTISSFCFQHTTQVVSQTCSYGCSNNQCNPPPPPPPVRQCNDGFDNDHDGFIDYPADLGCSSRNDNSELPVNVPQCNDGFDNDHDGKIDYPADLQCSSRLDNSE